MDEKVSDKKISDKIDEKENVKLVVAQTPMNSTEISPLLMKAIQDTVAASISSFMQKLLPTLDKVTPRDQSKNEMPLLNPAQPPVQSAYKTKLKGIDVDPGQDLRHVHPNRIAQWFSTVETRWKDQYNNKKIHGTKANMSWTRG